jgi:two-component system phosphate regulon response regulator PhoB
VKVIAVIDDSRTVLDLVSHVLGEAGYRVLATSHPTQAELMPDGREPDLFLVDVNMPEMLGDDLPTFLRDAWDITAPIFLYSDIPEEQLASRTKLCEADDYVCKAWGIERLIERVEAVFAEQAKKQAPPRT